MQDPDQYDFLQNDKPVDGKIDFQETEVIESDETETESNADPVRSNQNDAPSASINEVETKGLQSALMAERQKRQYYEQQLKERDDKKFDPSVFYEDPSTIENYVNKRTQDIHITMSRELIKGLHEDYDDMEQLFIAEAGNDRSLVEKMVNSQNPAKFAYEYGKKLMRMSDIESGDYEKNIRAEIEAKLRSEMGMGAARVPQDLSNARSASTQSQSFEPASIESLLPPIGSRRK